jgi:hypothetical protein
MVLVAQLLHHFPSTRFTALVRKHQTERNAKDFACWTQLVSMLFCHLSHAVRLSLGLDNNRDKLRWIPPELCMGR